MSKRVGARKSKKKVGRKHGAVVSQSNKAGRGTWKLWTAADLKSLKRLTKSAAKHRVARIADKGKGEPTRNTGPRIEWKKK
jgi:hypothetical protein